MSIRAVKPVYTETQAAAVSLAIRCYLEDGAGDRIPAREVRVMQNALRQTEIARRETRRKT